MTPAEKNLIREIIEALPERKPTGGFYPDAGWQREEEGRKGFNDCLFRVRKILFSRLKKK